MSPVAPLFLTALLSAPAAAVTPLPVSLQEGVVLPAERPQDTVVGSGARQFHAGVELRADFWRHPLRAVVGASFRRLDLSLVADPGVFIDGKHDADLLFGWWIVPRAWEVSLGWRNSSTRIDQGRRFSELLLIGLDAAMPLLHGPHSRATFGLLFWADLARHGGGVPTRTIPGSFPDISDYIGVSFNARLEFASPF